MKSLFREDSPIRQAIASLADDLLYSVLTLICCLPVATIGTAITALFDMIVNLETGKETGIGAYFKGFRKHFRRATISWILVLITGTVILFGLRLNTAGNAVVWGFLFLLIWIWLLFAMHLPPQLVRGQDQPLPNVWKSALITGIGLLPQSIVLIATAALPLALYAVAPDVFWYISFFWVFFWPAILARLFLKLIKKYFPEFSKESTDDETDE